MYQSPEHSAMRPPGTGGGAPDAPQPPGVAGGCGGGGGQVSTETTIESSSHSANHEDPSADAPPAAPPRTGRPDKASIHAAYAVALGVSITGEEVRAALAAARQLAEDGVVIIRAYRCLDKNKEWLPTGGERGYELPVDFEKTEADPVEVKDWQPRMGLFAVDGPKVVSLAPTIVRVAGTTTYAVAPRRTLAELTVSAAPEPASALSIPVIGPGESTLDAAFKYAKAGWYLAPVRPDDRKNPGSRLGTGWPAKTSRDPGAIASFFSGNNDGLALHNGRSGAISFDVDHPEKLHPLIAKAIAELSPPHQSSRPGQLGRGHYVFALPPGRTPGNTVPKALAGGWGEIRGRNGVIIVAPSPHAAPDGHYEWKSTGEVPMLPDYLLDLLIDAPEADTAATDAEVQQFIDQHTTEERPDLLDVHVRSVCKKVAAGESRHDTMVGHLLGAMRDSAAGLLDAKTAADALESLFIDVVSRKPIPGSKQDKPRTGRRARAEFAGILSWAVGQAVSTDCAAHRRRVIEKVGSGGPYGSTAAGGDGGGGGDPVTGEVFSAPRPQVSVEEYRQQLLKPEFWESRPLFEAIRRFARKRRVSPWSLLFVVLARACAAVPPWVVLPDTIGAIASLNIFVALCAGPAGKKSSVMAAAREFLTIHGGVPFRTEVPSTGQGLAACYVSNTDVMDASGKKKVGTKMVQHSWSVLAVVDEIDNVGSLSEVKGSTLVSTLKSIWSGAELGQANATADLRRKVEPHAYRFPLVAGVQPANAGAILADLKGGFPQRWLWVDSFNPDVATAAEIAADPDPPGWTWQVPAAVGGAERLPDGSVVLLPNAALKLPAVAVQAILDADDARNLPVWASTPLGAEYDGHALLSRTKVAGLLALLDGRLQVTEQDWDLSGVLTEISDTTRSHVVRMRGEEATHESDGAAERQGRSAAIAADSAAELRVVRAMSAIRNALGKRDGDHSHNAVIKLVGSRYRDVADEAIERMVGTGELACEEGVGRNGKTATYYHPAVKKP